MGIQKWGKKKKGVKVKPAAGRYTRNTLEQRRDSPAAH